MKALPWFSAASVATHLIPRAWGMLRFTRRSRAEMVRRQFERLQKIVAHAYARCPLYREKFDRAGIRPDDIRSAADVRRLPFTTKSELIDAFPDGIVAGGAAAARKLILSRTSGSSGRVATVAFSRAELAAYMLAGLRSYHLGMGWKPWYRQYSIYTSIHPLQKLLGRWWLRFASTLAPVSGLAEEWRSFRPSFVTAYPSYVREIMAHMKKAAIAPPPLRAIITNSEMLYPADRPAFESFFGCPVFDEYASEELNRIASQCRAGRYHVWEDLNYLETVNDAGEPVDEGEIVGTHLVNFSMPLIRYRQGDRVRLSADMCPCGVQTRLVSNIQGRINQDLVFSNGARLYSGLLLDLMYDAILARPDAIADFCLIQAGADRLRIEIIPGKAWDAEAAGALRRNFQSRIGEGATVDVAVVDSLTKTRTGKRSPVIRIG